MNRPQRTRATPWRALAFSGLIGAGALMGACTRHDPQATAREYIAKGEYSAALVHLRAAVQAEPGSAELRVLLADMQERAYDLPGAQENLVKALEAGADVNGVVPRVALLMLDRNETDALIRAYRDTRLTDPAADSNLRGLVALAMLGGKRVEPARAQLALAVAPAPSVNLARAQLLVMDKKPLDALTLLDLDGAGSAAPWYVLRGGKRIAVEAGKPDQGLAYMKRALDAVPWHGGIAGEYGEALITVGRLDDARKVWADLRQRHPGLFWSHYLGSLLMHRERRFEEAHALALRALRGSPEHMPSLIMAASSELQKGDLLVAERRLQAMLRKHDDAVPIWQLYAQLQGRLGRPQEQAKAIKRGLELAPGDGQLLSQQADLQLAAGQFKPALATLQALLAARPQDPDAMLRLAQARFRAGDKAGASELVDKASAVAGNNSAASARAVEMALQLNNVAQARKLADQAVARQPEDAMARLSLAAVQAVQNDRAAAWATTVSVLDKQPDHPGALQALASLARTGEQTQELLKRHEAALDAGSPHPQTYLDFANLLLANPGDKRGTPVAVLERGVQKLPTALPLRQALIAQLLRTGDTDKAVATAQTGATMANASPAAVAMLASTYETLGRSQQAAESWRKLVADNPQRADWRLRLARLDAAAGRESEAIAQLRSLVSERPFDLQPYTLLAQLQGKADVNGALATARQLGDQPGFKGAGHLLAGDVLAASLRYDEALAEFDLAAKTGGAAIAITRVVKVLERSNRADAAERELEAALKKYPDDAELITTAAQRAQAKGNPAKAVELLSRLAARAPGNPYLLNDLAWAQLASGQAQAQALANAQRAASLLPDNPIVLHTLGMALSKAGKKTEAIDALRAAANLAPLSATPRLHLAQHLAAAGDKVGAASALRSIDGSALAGPERDSLGKLKAELGVT